MFLSDRDIKYAIESGKLKVVPPPEHYGCGYDENSIDLHLDVIESAKVWDIEKALEIQRKCGGPRDRHILDLGDFDYDTFSDTCLVRVPQPTNPKEMDDLSVYSRGSDVILKPGGFLLWTTEEVVGTPPNNPELLAFVNAKSKKARTGIMVHFTAPTINAGWEGKIMLEIVNLGPFVFSLKPKDAIAQLTVATISSRPDPTMRPPKKPTPTSNR